MAPPARGSAASCSAMGVEELDDAVVVHRHGLRGRCGRPQARTASAPPGTPRTPRACPARSRSPHGPARTARARPARRRACGRPRRRVKARLVAHRSDQGRPGVCGRRLRLLRFGLVAARQAVHVGQAHRPRNQLPPLSTGGRASVEPHLLDAKKSGPHPTRSFKALVADVVHRHGRVHGPEAQVPHPGRGRGQLHHTLTPDAPPGQRTRPGHGALTQRSGVIVA